jgi:hypothetical protein
VDYRGKVFGVNENQAEVVSFMVFAVVVLIIFVVCCRKDKETGQYMAVPLKDEEDFFQENFGDENNQARVKLYSDLRQS